MAVRALFRFVGTEFLYGGAQQLKFAAQYDTSIPEHKRFYDATPNGELRMCVNNPAAIEMFKLGEYYYLDMTPMTAEEKAASGF